MATSLKVGDQQIQFFPRSSEHDIVPGPGGYVVVHKPRSALDRVICFLESGNGGPFRLMQLGERVCKVSELLCNQLGNVSMAQGFKGVSVMFNKAWTGTILSHLPFALKDAKGGIDSLRSVLKDSNPATAQRKYVKAVQDISTGAAACGYSLALFSSIQAVSKMVPSVLKAAEYFTFIGDVCDLTQNVPELSKAQEFRRKVSVLKTAPELKQHFVDSERVCVLKTMKAVCSVSGFIFGTGLAVTGLATAPAWMLAAATLSLTGTVLAISAGLYEEGMRFDRTKFFSDKHIRSLNPVVA